MKAPSIYLCEFDSFLSSSPEIAAQRATLCEDYGFSVISPSIAKKEYSVTEQDAKEAVARQLFDISIKNIDSCDIVIANVNSLRGWEPDANTSFIMGYAYSKNKRLYAYMDDTRPCYEKFIGRIHKDGSLWRDDDGAFFESGALNLMLGSPATVIQGSLCDVLDCIKADLKLNGGI